METLNEMLARHGRELEKLRMEQRSIALAADRQRRQEAEALEAWKRQQDLERRIDAEASATHPTEMLNALRAAGVSLEVAPDGAIIVQPAGKLSQVHRRIIDTRRDEVVAMIRAAQQTETL